MAPLTPDQLRTRQRVSKIVEPEDVEYYPPRVTRESAPPPKQT